MAKNKLSGITISIGGDTTDLSKALKEPDKEASDLQYKLSVIEKTLKMDPGNTDIIAQKFRLLGQAIENTEKRLDILKTSQQQFISSGGDVDSSQYIELQRQIVRTSQQLDKLKSQRVDIDVKSSSVKSAQNEVDKLDKTIDDAEESSKSFSESFAGAFSGAAIADGLSSISEAMQGVVEDSKEYMKIMGALEVSSEQAGYTADQTRQTYQLLYSVMADDQTAATTTANLQAIGLSQEKLTELTYASIGAWAKYGDSIPIDGLAESINETIKAGEVTGTFADVLNWASGGEDEFNEKLANCKDASERANLVLQEMADQGLTKSAQKYLDNNSALVENNNLQAEWQENMAKLSEQILPMLNDITEFVNGLIDGFLSLPEPAQTVITVILGVIAVLSALAPVIMAVAAAATALNVGLLPIIGVIAAIALAIAGIILVIQNWDEICEWFSQKWQEFTGWIGQKWQEFTGWFSEKADAVGLKKVDLGTNEREFRHTAAFTVSLTFSPYEYLVSGKRLYDAEECMLNMYDTCRPIYYIEGEGMCTLTVNGNEMTANVGQNLTIDTELKLAYRTDGTAQNTIVTGDFDDMVLVNGINDISVSSGFRLKIRPNWRCI